MFTVILIFHSSDFSVMSDDDQFAFPSTQFLLVTSTQTMLLVTRHHAVHFLTIFLTSQWHYDVQLVHNEVPYPSLHVHTDTVCS